MKGESVKKIIYTGAASLALGLIMSTDAFAGMGMSAPVTSKVYYCSATTTYASSSCPSGDTSNLLPSTASISQTSVDALNSQNPGLIGAVLGGTSPSKLWAYIVRGSVAPSMSGLAMTTSNLTGANSGKNIAVSAY